MNKYNLTNAQIKAIANLAVQENGEKGVENEVSLMANLYELQSKYKDIYLYIRNSGWFSKAAFWMDSGKSSDLAVAKVRSVLENGKRTVPAYVNEHDAISDIVSVTNNGKAFFKYNRNMYKKDVTVIKNCYGSTYTFYCFASTSPYSDPMGYTADAYKKKSGAESTQAVKAVSSAIDVSKVIAVASAEVGYLEKKSKASLDSKTANAGSGNYTKYWRDMKPSYQGQPYCDCFVSWCFKKAYGESLANKLLCGGLYSFYTPESAQKYKDKGQWYTKSPKIGDQIFFKNDTRICHTGIVYKVDTSNVYTIEGNTSAGSQVIPNGGAVCKKSYALTNSRIAGYGRPNYGSTASSTASNPPSTKSTPTKLTEQVSWYGTVTASSLNVRKWAGTEHDTVSFSPLNTGTKVGVCAAINADDGTKWYYIKYDNKYGFVSAKYIERL